MPSAPSDLAHPPGARRLPDSGPGRSVALWWLDTSRPVDLHLDTADRERITGLADERARHRLGAARSMLRAVLGSMLGVPPQEVVIDRRCDRCGSPHGAPRIVAPTCAWRLSTSAAGARSLLAVSAGGAVGVDLERLRPVRSAARRAHQVLVGDEADVVDAVAAADAAEALLRQWVRKEAVVKAMGVGLPAGLDRFEVLDGSDPSTRVAERPTGPSPAPGWWLEGVEVEAGWVAALAVRTDVGARYSPATRPEEGPA